MLYTTFVLALLLAPFSRALPQVSPAEAATATTTSASSWSDPSSDSWSPTPPPTTTTTMITTPDWSPKPHEPEPNANAPAPSPLRATFDAAFDGPSLSLDNVACSNGPNGLLSRFPTLGDVPSFPFVGGAFDVAWNSPNCGACWNVTNPATGVWIALTAVDTSGAGFNIAEEVFKKLSGGQVDQGVLDVVASKVSPSVCGL
ncbi:Cerato-platanin-domain-containing protein [Russula earlei]|uniref:Cerato-platanin-domain-containing protein n=1 Tax=Russula earlei TaxID=71964 RepID=A0ACC0UKG4_9AGAM|nr:Cerato-platanin-domain-containing protein [Russula earlei]